MASTIDWQEIRGDTWAWEFTVLKPNKQDPQDITGAQFRLTAKYDPADFDGEAPIVGTSGSGQCQVTDGPAGIVEVIIPPSQTKLVTAPTTLRYDLQATDGAGNVWTVAKGRIVVEADISLVQP
jgi:hypothetical protein